MVVPKLLDFVSHKGHFLARKMTLVFLDPNGADFLTAFNF
jgi:hypothetical protein